MTMLRKLAEAVDQAVISMAYRAIRRYPPADSRLDEARVLLEHPDFFCDFATTAPRDFTFHKRGNFSFTSACQSALEFNNTVWGRLYTSSTQWESRPTVILLHGWNGEKGARFLFPLVARRLNAAGVNAAMFALPFHGKRKPTGNLASPDFISHDLERMVMATRQSIADARSLIGWLQAQGSPWMGVWGISLGGWLAGLLSCVETRLSAAVLFTPITRIDHAIETLPFCEPVRAGLVNQPPLRLEQLNLMAHVPNIPPDRMLIVKSEYDLFTDAAGIEELWHRWGKPVIHRYRAGHISILFSPAAMRRIVKFIVAQAGVQPGSRSG